MWQQQRQQQLAAVEARAPVPDWPRATFNYDNRTPQCSTSYTHTHTDPPYIYRHIHTSGKVDQRLTFGA